MAPHRTAAVLAVLCAGTLASPALAADANAPSRCGTPASPISPAPTQLT